MGLFSLSKHRSSPRHITLGWRKLVLSANQASTQTEWSGAAAKKGEHLAKGFEAAKQALQRKLPKATNPNGHCTSGPPQPIPHYIKCPIMCRQFDHYYGCKHVPIKANFESGNIEEFRNVFPAYDVQFVANCFSAFIRGSTVYYVNFDSELRYQPIKDSNQYRSIELEDIKPVKVDGTAQHIYVLDDDGLLFQISQTPCEKHLLLNEGDIKFKSFACGKEHLVALSYNGDVYSYGGGSRGQLGNGSIETSSKLQIVEALQGVKMKQVVAGGWHNLVLSEIGDIYSWGWNEAGQAGLPCLKDSNGNVKQDKSSGSSLIRYPTLLFEDDVDLTFTDISAGSRHSAALTDAGDLYTWGWNQYGQIGAVSESVIVCDTPYKVPTKGRKISSVKCACWDTLIFADDSS